VREPVDRLERPLRELRISVTDRCNLRCSYCMPREVFGPDFTYLTRAELLSFEEIARLARIFAQLGVGKLRLTGGEPLLRARLDRLVAMLAALDGIEEIALTSNGLALAARAAALRDAGLSRVTVSLDALEDASFGAMDRLEAPVARVLAGIDGALAAGLAPVKVNMVVRRGVNEHCILPMAEHFRERGLELRFIEYMDVGTTNGWSPADVVPADEVRAMLEGRWALEPVAGDRAEPVAARFRYRDGGGYIGLIASVTKPFCGGCTRARLSSDGRLHTCLFSGDGHDLRAPLRAGADDAQLSQLIAGIWSGRSDRYSQLRAQSRRPPARPEMSYIGG